MKILQKSLCAGLFLAILTACGPLYENNLGTKLLEASQQMTGLGPAPTPKAPVLAPEVANAAPGDVLLVKILARNAVAPMTKVAQNGTAITWISPGKVTMSFEDGILVGTRGLGDDLMGVDAFDTRAAINAGGGVVQRRQSFLTSEDQIATRDMTCTISNAGPETLQTIAGPRETVKFEEDCKGPALVFKNSYWVAVGAIVKSLQAVSAGVGFIEVNQL